MSSFRLSTIYFCRTLLGTLICCYMLTDHVTAITDDSNFAKIPAYRTFQETGYGLNEASHLRSLRSALGMDNIGQITYPLTSRSAAMISGRGFRPGKRYDAEVISFM
ncbi:hypothetical protein QQG55_47485 [Brugia pahangi]|uniref:Secreted protein n=1 Tax=Brugia pahangi TaxID=6280 RepID=A0A0N4TM68_BRUPA|nr:unnamed protein product [Brugia pahangi]